MARRRMADPVTALLGRGIYSVPDAARLANIPRASLRRWMRVISGAPSESSEPVIRGELPVLADTFALSFLDLMEARALHAFRLRGVGS